MEKQISGSATMLLITIINDNNNNNNISCFLLNYVTHTSTED